MLTQMLRHCPFGRIHRISFGLYAAGYAPRMGTPIIHQFKNSNINKMLTMHFKPDYAIDNLRANNYICHFSVFHKRLLDGDELFRSKYDGSQDHDMILRLTANARKVVPFLSSLR